MPAGRAAPQLADVLAHVDTITANLTRLTTVLNREFTEQQGFKALRETLDKLKDKLRPAAIVLAAVVDGKVQLAAGVTPELIGRIKAGELVNFVAQQVGGKGGGKPDMAMAGGTDPSSLPGALASVQAWVAERA